VKYVVVDEADTLFDEGFKDDLQKVFYPIQVSIALFFSL
jgi:superfamily II DNA/RNA helicase